VTQALIDFTLARLAYIRDMEILRVTPNGIEFDRAPIERLQEEEETP
jgi:hypothetical protein